MEHHHFIVAGLKRGLQVQRIWQNLVSEQGFQGRYWSVKLSLMRLKARQPLPFRRRETASGVDARVDFGQGDFGQVNFGQRAWVMGQTGNGGDRGICRQIVFRDHGPAARLTAGCEAESNDSVRQKKSPPALGGLT